MVVNDLVRAPLHYLGTWFLTLWTSPVSRHDARMSVRRGFRVEELRGLLRAGGLDAYEVERHFLYRFLLILEKGRYSSRGIWTGRWPVCDQAFFAYPHRFVPGGSIRGRLGYCDPLPLCHGVGGLFFSWETIIVGQGSGRRPWMVGGGRGG